MMPPPHSQRPTAPHRRLEAWLWTGPVGHLLGGSVDLLVALARYRLARARGRIPR